MKYLVLLILLTPFAFANTVVSNTADWQAIYSAGIYAANTNSDFLFIVSPQHAENILLDVPKEEPITLIEGTGKPFARDYDQTLIRQGRPVTRINIHEKTANLELARKTPATKFIIADPAYGYDAITLSWYAANLDNYILFADRNNINDITQFLSERKPEHILLFGDLDPIVTDALTPFNPEIINGGSKINNNLAIAQRYTSFEKPTQAILTSGEFLEHDFFKPGLGQPIIYLGKEEASEETLNFLRTSNFESLVLLGNDLVTPAQQVKDATQLPLFIKFGKGRTSNGGFINVEGLDIYPTPLIDVLLAIEGAYYSIENQSIIISIKNERRARTYTRPSTVVRVDGQPEQTFTHERGTIDGFATANIAEQLDLSPHIERNITADIFIPYGAFSDASDKTIRASIPIEIISGKDECAIDITSATYNAATKRIELETTTEKPCLVQITLTSITINGEPTQLSSERAQINDTLTITIRQELSEADLADNPTLHATIRSGEKRLTHTKTQDITFNTTKIPWNAIIIAALITVIIILIWTRKKR